MFFLDRIPCKVPSIIALIDIWQRDKDWTEIKPLDDCISGLKSNLQMDEELDWNENGLKWKWKMDMWSDLNHRGKEITSTLE